MDLLTAATDTMVDLLATNNAGGDDLVGWPLRMADIESVPWVRVMADYQGLYDREEGAGDQRTIGYRIQCRADSESPGDAFTWVEDALGRSLELPDKLTHDTIQVFRSDFEQPSDSEQGADYWERTYTPTIVAALICNPEPLPV